jgi:hypothetical protein
MEVGQGPNWGCSAKEKKFPPLWNSCSDVMINTINNQPLGEATFFYVESMQIDEGSREEDLKLSVPSGFCCVRQSPKTKMNIDTGFKQSVISFVILQLDSLFVLAPTSVIPQQFILMTSSDVRIILHPYCSWNSDEGPPDSDACSQEEDTPILLLNIGGMVLLRVMQVGYRAGRTPRKVVLLCYPEM